MQDDEQRIQLLDTLAETAQLMGGDDIFLRLYTPGGSILIHNPEPGVVEVAASWLALEHRGTPQMCLTPQQTVLARLPAAPRDWAQDPEARWAEVQLLLRDHAGRPVLLSRLITTICMEAGIFEGASQTVRFCAHDNPEWHAYLSSTNQRKPLPLPLGSRVAALKPLTVCCDDKDSELAPDLRLRLIVERPPSMHALLAWTHRHGSALSQLEQLEAAWLPGGTTSKAA